MAQDKILIARHVQTRIIAMVCYCGERAFGSAEGDFLCMQPLIFNPRLFWAPLTCNYLAFTV